jgi:hypothetical protein
MQMSCLTPDRMVEPPNITARPSIIIPYPDGYHGWLTTGELIPC